jgi:hypothetical protein
VHIERERGAKRIQCREKDGVDAQQERHRNSARNQKLRGGDIDCETKELEKRNQGRRTSLKDERRQRAERLRRFLGSGEREVWGKEGMVQFLGNLDSLPYFSTTNSSSAVLKIDISNCDN